MTLLSSRALCEFWTSGMEGNLLLALWYAPLCFNDLRSMQLRAPRPNP